MSKACLCPAAAEAMVCAMQIPVRELSMADRAELERHFLALDPEDRRLRFGATIADATVRAYVKRIAFDRDTVFGVADDNLRLLGVAHLARLERAGELGLSVLKGHRQRGLGGALMARAAMRARNLGLRTLFMHCLAENDAILHLARKLGMDIVTEAPEADARLSLPPADASSLFGEVLEQRLALFDHALKAQSRLLVAALKGNASGA
ncbi:MAG TPA: GNAT family N-acetyltransferase [Burkholderiales bacterium]|nr:GNAT family N-acetyltransferase [Burkholderiales bacterium]